MLQEEYMIQVRSIGNIKTSPKRTLTGAEIRCSLRHKAYRTTHAHGCSSLGVRKGKASFHPYQGTHGHGFSSLGVREAKASFKQGTHHQETANKLQHFIMEMIIYLRNEPLNQILHKKNYAS